MRVKCSSCERFVEWSVAYVVGHVVIVGHAVTGSVDSPRFLEDQIDEVGWIKDDGKIGSRYPGSCATRQDDIRSRFDSRI